VGVGLRRGDRRAQSLAQDRPAYEPPVIVEITRDEIAALLKACDVTLNWRNPRQPANPKTEASVELASVDLGGD
jgi:hypothetical protein